MSALPDTHAPAVPGGALEFARRIGYRLTPVQECYLDALDGGRPPLEPAELTVVGARAGRRDLRAIVAAWALITKGESVTITGRTAAELGQARDDVADVLRRVDPALRPPTLTLVIRDEIA